MNKRGDKRERNFLGLAAKKLTLHIVNINQIVNP